MALKLYRDEDFPFAEVGETWWNTDVAFLTKGQPSYHELHQIVRAPVLIELLRLPRYRGFYDDAERCSTLLSSVPVGSDSGVLLAFHIL